jgi:hypothetical protein
VKKLIRILKLLGKIRVKRQKYIMSHKYFAKWIPIEGKVEEGDICKHSLTGFLGRLEYWNSEKMGKRDEGYYLVNKDDFQGVSKSYLQKVKLFICSRDISIGDEIVYIGPDITLEALPEELRFKTGCKSTCTNPKTISREFWVKVIAEVSPKEDIKEGQEFDRNDFELRWTNSKGENSLTMKDVDTEEESPVLKAYFKCPTCGTFH